ncbi:MAG: hypothetical protein SchgKO_12230 [Schleiferiaceae bacterium]
MNKANIMEFSFGQGPVKGCLTYFEEVPTPPLPMELCLRDQVAQENFSHPSSLKSFYSARYAAAQIVDPKTIIYEGQRPMLNNGKHLSLSHTHGWGAAVTGQMAVGVDIELERPKISVVAPKFVNEYEKTWVNPETTLHAHVIWGAKESIFKMYALGGVDFKAHINVLGPPSGHDGAFEAKFVKSGEEFSAQMYYQKIEDIHVVFGFRI